MKVKVILLCLVMGLVILIGGLRYIEYSLLYQPSQSQSPNDPLAMIQSDWMKDRLQEVYFTTTGECRLNGWYIKTAPGNPTILFAHGNGGNMGDRWAVIEAFAKHGYNVFAFDYRGYGKSQCTPSEQAIYQDLESASGLLTVRYDVPVSEQILIGGSLGGGVVAETASKQNYKAVVIYSSFTSVPDVLHYHFENKRLGWIPFALLTSQKYNSLEKIDRIRSPLLIIHSNGDPFIPVFMSQALYDHATSTVRKKLVFEDSQQHGVSANLVMAELEKLLAK